MFNKARSNFPISTHKDVGPPSKRTLYVHRTQFSDGKKCVSFAARLWIRMLGERSPRLLSGSLKHALLEDMITEG
jgi:hypothetical protein